MNFRSKDKFETTQKKRKRRGGGNGGRIKRRRVGRVKAIRAGSLSDGDGTENKGRNGRTLEESRYRGGSRPADNDERRWD